MSSRLIIRAFEKSDQARVVDLFIRINRELAPVEMREQFERYIQAALSEEISRLHEIFVEARHNAFWVVEANDELIGSLGSRIALAKASLKAMRSRVCDPGPMTSPAFPTLVE